MRLPDAVGEPEVRVFDDPAGASHAAAEEIAGVLRGAVERRRRADWATTGGSTPIGVYRELAVDPLRDEVPWAEVHAWWGDDRFVPRDHPLSNVLPFDQVLLSATAHASLSGTGEYPGDVERHAEPGVPMPVANVHAPRMADAIAHGGLEWAVADYDRELKAASLPLGDDGFPAFDLLFVGIGPDGHLLSCFPGSPLFGTTSWVAAVAAPTHVEPHVDRLSLHPAVVVAARRVILVAHGAGKAAILATVLREARDPRRWPAQLARRAGATWFLDRAAAARLG